MSKAEKSPCVYLLAAQRNGTLYVGLTFDLIHRVAQHRDESRGLHYTLDYPETNDDERPQDTVLVP